MRLGHGTDSLTDRQTDKQRVQHYLMPPKGAQKDSSMSRVLHVTEHNVLSTFTILLLNSLFK